MRLAFEDFQPGYFATFGPQRVTRAELLAFAAEFDPQPMHLDEEAAKKSMLKGLSGSGWHLCAIAMRMQVDGFLNTSESAGGLGVDEVKWLAPLRPDDDLTLKVFIETTRASNSRPDLGIVKFRSEMFNASGQCLMTVVTNGLMRRRTAQTSGQAD